MTDKFGPQELMYCADGGVYYAYNFIEEAPYLAKLGYLWGAKKLSEIGLNSSVSISFTNDTPITDIR